MMHFSGFIRSSRHKFMACVLIVFCSIILLSYYSKPVIGLDPAKSIADSTQLNIQKFLDKTASKEFDEVLQLKDEDWQATKDQITGYYLWEADYWAAPKGAILWLKIQLPQHINETDHAASQKVWLELLPNVGMNGEIALLQEGHWVWQAPVKHDSLAESFQPAKYLTFLFDSSRSGQTAYIRLSTQQTFQFSLKLRSFEELPAYFMGHNLFFGLVAGMLCLALIYNFVIGLYAKEPVYLYYAFYVFCNLLYSSIMEGYTRLLFPDWGNTAIVSNTATNLLVLSAFLFIRQFLDTRTALPRFDSLIRGTIWLLIIWIVCLGFVPDIHAYLITIIFGICSPILGLIGGTLSYKQGHPMARYFLIAWFFFLISAGCWGWMWLGLVEPKAWVVWFYLLGTLLEVVLLSMVLGFRFSTLKNQTLTLNEAKSRYRELSETDDLTKLFNRRGFIKHVEYEFQKHTDQGFVWLALDVDNFKSFNDMYGHPAGDELLEKMGDLLIKKCRKENIVGRIGGEEFAILLVNSTLTDAENFCKRLLIDFAAINVRSAQGQLASTTLSIGATAIQKHERIEDAWKRADKLLYQAKEQGRNRAVLST
ncbi:MAG: diguanylate cyclase [Oleiphilus sp.]